MGVFPKPDLRQGRKVVRWRASTVADWVDANATGGAR
jgi:predicted DNA-binding transcriptional regulator AlpA